MALPEIAIEQGLSEQNAVMKDNRERLQKSLHAGQLNIVKSIDLGFKGLISFEKIKLEQQKIQQGFQLEALREAARAGKDGDDKGGDQKLEKKDTYNWLLMLGMATTLLSGIAKGIVDAIRAWGKTVKGTLKLLLAPFAVLLAPIIDPIKGMFGKEGRIGKFFASIGRQLRLWALIGDMWVTLAIDGIKGIFGPEGKVGKLFSKLGSTLRTFADSGIEKFTKFGETLKALLGPEGSIGKMITKFTSPFKTFSTSLITNFTKFGETLKALLTPEGSIGKMIAGVKGLFAEGGTVSKIVQGVKGIFTFPFQPLMDVHGKEIKAIFSAGDGASGPIAKIIAAVKSPFTTAVDLVKTAMTPITNLFGEGGTVTKIIDKFKTAFKIFKEGSGIMKTLGAVGRVLGRLFFPFTVIMAIWDTVKGAIEGFEEGGIIGGILGAISGLLTGLIGIPLDLLKSVVSWIAGKLGFKGAEKFLDSFDIATIMKSIITEPINTLKIMANGILEFLADKVDKFSKVPFIGDMAKSAAAGLRGLKMKTEKFEVKEAENPEVKLEQSKKEKADALAAEQKRKQAEQDAKAVERAIQEERERRSDKFRKAIIAQQQARAQEQAALQKPPAASTGTGGAPTVVTDASTQNNVSTSSQSTYSAPVSPEYHSPKSWGGHKRNWGAGRIDIW